MKHVWKVVTLLGAASLGYLLGRSATIAEFTKKENFDEDFDWMDLNEDSSSKDSDNSDFYDEDDYYYDEDEIIDEDIELDWSDEDEDIEDEY